jgi:excisionase family DNA binding protein
LEKEYLSVIEASKLICLARSTIYNYIYNRHIPFIKIGGRVVFDKEDLIKWMEKKKVKGLYKKE